MITIRQLINVRKSSGIQKTRGSAVNKTCIRYFSRNQAIKHVFSILEI